MEAAYGSSPISLVATLSFPRGGLSAIHLHTMATLPRYTLTLANAPLLSSLSLRQPKQQLCNQHSEACHCVRQSVCMCRVATPRHHRRSSSSSSTCTLHSSSPADQWGLWPCWEPVWPQSVVVVSLQKGSFRAFPDILKSTADSGGAPF